MQGTPIYDLVSSAYQVTLVGAFVPLVFGLYWSRATTQGAVLSIALGIGTWLAFLLNAAWGEAFPGQLAGLLAGARRHGRGFADAPAACQSDRSEDPPGMIRPTPGGA